MAQLNHEQNFIKQLFRSEITWIITIVGVVWGFVTSVVLPIQALQISTNNIQAQLTSESSRYTDHDTRITTLEKSQAVVLSKLKIEVK